MQFRRVVTGHGASGRAIVKIDEIAKNLAVVMSDEIDMVLVRVRLAEN